MMKKIRVQRQCLNALSILGLLFFASFNAWSQDVGNNISVVSVDDWRNGFNATFEYEIQSSDVVDDLVRDWRIEIDYSGGARINGAYTVGYMGTVQAGNIAPDGGYAITNEGAGFRPELDAGFKLKFVVQGQRGEFNASDFTIEFVNLTVLPTNEFQASVVDVNDWYDPSWGGGFNATFRCNVLGPDASFGPVTNLLIEFNYSGSGSPSTAWTESHDGPIEYGYVAPDGGYAISNLGGFQPELYAGDSITFAIQVQNAGFDPSHFDIRCRDPNVNLAPIAIEQQLAIDEDTVGAISLVGEDEDGDVLTYTISAQPEHGVINGTAPDVEYTPTDDFTGSDTFSFLVNDGELDSEIATVTITVVPVNDQPVSTNLAIETQENMDVEIVLMGDDVDGDVLSYEVVVAPQFGQLSGTAPALIYTPNLGFDGLDSFTYRVSDGQLASDESSVQITVINQNDPPTIEPLATGQATENVLFSYDVDATDPNDDVLSYALAAHPDGMTIDAVTGVIQWQADAQYAQSVPTLNSQCYVIPEGGEQVTGGDGNPVAVSPLSQRVRSAITRASDFVAPQTRAWDETNGCLGCHVQNQTLLGLQASMSQADVDEEVAEYLLSGILSSQQSDGSIRRSHPQHSNTQTGFALWALSYVPDRDRTFDVRSKALGYFAGVQRSSTTDTTWATDHSSGWLNSRGAVTSVVALAASRYLTEIDDRVDLTAEQLAVAMHYKLEMPRIAAYFLSRGRTGGDFIILALRLIGLAEMVEHIADPLLVGEINAAILEIDTYLRGRQHSSGGWQSSAVSVGARPPDPLASAWVGFALAYQNPPITDPVIKNNIEYLLSTQESDGTWTTTSGLFATKLGTTALVMAYLPIALDFLGNPDVTVHEISYDNETESLSAQVSNRGLGDVSAPIVVNFYNGDPSLGELLGSTTVEGLASEDVVTAVAATIAPTKDVHVVVEVTPAVPECLVENNHAIAVYTEIEVDDGQGGTDLQIVLVNVADVNEAPTITSEPLTLLAQGTDYDYTVQVSDPDVGDAHRFSLTTGPAGLSVDIRTGKFSSDVDLLPAGDHVVTVRALDLRGLFAEQTFTLTVIANTAPTIGSVPTTMVSVGNTYTHDVDASDDDGDAVTYALRVSPLSMSIDAETGLITWVPTEQHLGVQSVEVVVTDSRGGETTQSFDITVSANNSPPVISSLPSTTHVLNKQIMDSGPLDLIDWQETVYSHNPAYGLTDEAPIWIVDATNQSVIQGTNSNPTIYLSPIPLTEYIIRGKIKVDSRDDDDFVGFVFGHQDVNSFYLLDWKQERQNLSGDVAERGLSLKVFDLPENEDPSFWPTNPQNGQNLYHSPIRWVDVVEYDIAIALLSGRIYVQVTEAGTLIESFVVEDSTFTGGQFGFYNNSQPGVVYTGYSSSSITSGTYTYSLVATDEDFDDLEYSLLSGPAGVQIDLETGVLVWQLDGVVPGSYAITLQVDDGNGGIAQQDYVLEVQSGAPVVISTPVTLVEANSAYQYQVIAVSADANTGLTYSLIDAPIGLTIDAVSGLMGWSPSDGNAGVHAVSVRIVDENGNESFHTFSIEVTSGIVIPNNAPTITSQPVFSATPDATYEYDVDATDADGDVLAYTLTTPPTGMSIDGVTGLINWQPQSDQAGAHQVDVVITDARGAFATQSYTVTVSDIANATPTISSAPALSAQVATEYSYAIVATDDDGDTLSYELVSGPAGMSLSTDGLLTWTPATAELVPVPVTVRVSDATAYAEQSWTIAVSDVNAPLDVTISIDPANPQVGDTITVSVTPTGGSVDPVVSVTVNDIAISPNASGEYVVSADAVGTVDVVVTVDDGTSSVTQSTSYTVVDPGNPSGLPVVALVTPGDDETLTAPVDVIGSVSDDNLTSWMLIAQARGAVAGEFITLAEGATVIDESVLGQIDTSLLMNGLYDIILQATDGSGQIASDSRVVRVDGDLKVGNFSITFEDLSIPMVGIPIQVTRTYDSRQRHENLDFGYGWSIDYQNVTVHESRAPGLGWELNQYSTGPLGALTDFCVEPQGAPLVTVTLPDGQVETFETAASPRCNLVPILDVELVFNPEAGTTSTLRALNGNLGRLNQSLGVISDITGSEPRNPDRYELTTKAGYVYVLDQSFGIETVTDPNGHTLTYSDTGIVHSAGKSIDFVRDGEGRITEISDPSGNLISYSYDANGDLLAVTDRAFATTNFSYNTNHGLLDIVDPLGNRVVRNIYDDSGRLIAQEDNQGNRTDFNHNLAGRESIVTDRLGRNTFFYYDERGNVTSMVNALGQTSTYSFDAFDNQLSETNPLGQTTTATFDGNRNQLSQTDALGNTVSYAYNSRGQETRITDARGNAFNNSYDGVGNLLTVTDPLGNVAGQNINAQGLASLRQDAENYQTLFEYDSEGNLTKQTDAEGGVTTSTYDQNNNLLSQTRTRTLNGTTLNETTTYEYNGRDQLVKVTNPLGQVSRTDYDLSGRELAQIDVLGRRTEMVYDAYGRLTQTTYPDGTSDTSAYDVEGNKLSDTDRLGRTTTYRYDALNRSVETTFADGSSVSTAHDAAGRVVTETDERGNDSTHAYDAAGRRVSTTDALGNTFSFAYDSDGNVVTETDARGNTTTHTYNALDQRIRTTFADSTTMASTFDKRGLEIAKTDQNGRTTNYAYDGQGRLTSVTDALNQVTSYGYDEAGNKLTQTDALGRVTAWAYDALGRPTSRTLPLGQSESYAYDVVGNRISHTDFNGATHTFTYDANNDWLVGENWADGRSTSYTYNAIGQRVNATDSNGSFSYSYDDRGRLISETKHDGSQLTYGYDAAGNRTTLNTLASGISTSTTYTFDALNRLATVTADDNTVTTYGYDANGNQTSVSHGNGTSTATTFDALNRVTAITHLGTVNETIGSFSYTLDPTGRRTQIVEANGRTSTYTYDDLYRLVGESIIDAVNGNHTSSYQYDAVGNRISETVNGVQTAYSVDDNDRLVQQGGNTYNYDANGNTISDSLDGVTNTYSYDSQNRLTGSSKNGQSIAMTYDMDGNRLSQNVDGDTTAFLVDTNMPYAQVLIESNSLETLQYTFGSDLLSLVSGVDNYTYHTDALGSTRLLSDSVGQVVDEVSYDAWGEQLVGDATSLNKYRYAGEQYDEDLDLYYLRARYLDSSSGRFIGQDDFQGIQSLPASGHKYLYTPDDPVNFIDPSGNFFGFTLAQNIGAVLLTANIATTGISVADVLFSDSSNGAKSVKIGGLLLLSGLGGSYTKLIAQKLGLNIGALAARSGVWALPALERGRKIEQILASTKYAAWFNVGALNRGFFPLVDFQLGNVLVSLKTLDPFSKTNRVGDIIRHINKLAQGHKVNGQIADVILDLRVPPGTEELLKSLVSYGKERGVTVKISSFFQ